MYATALIDTLIPAVEQVKICLLMNCILLFWCHFLKHCVKRYHKHFLKHLWEKIAQSFVEVGDLRIRVHLDEPHAKVLVNHKIESEKFISVFTLARVQSRST